MWGKNLCNWFELFAGIVVYKMTDNGPDNNEGWINITEFEKCFTRGQLTFAGNPYDPSDAKQRSALLDAIIAKAGLLCTVKLLERRRNIVPPSLDYRVTTFGRKVDSWGYGSHPGLRKKTFFFAIELFFRLKKHQKLVTFGTAGWAMLNAYKFYATTFEWLSNDLFAVVSACGIILLIWVVHFVKLAFGGTE
jgi:hypothetical protein